MQTIYFCTWNIVFLLKLSCINNIVCTTHFTLASYNIFIFLPTPHTHRVLSSECFWRFEKQQRSIGQLERGVSIAACHFYFILYRLILPYLISFYHILLSDTVLSLDLSFIIQLLTSNILAFNFTLLPASWTSPWTCHSLTFTAQFLPSLLPSKKWIDYLLCQSIRFMYLREVNQLMYLILLLFFFLIISSAHT